MLSGLKLINFSPCDQAAAELEEENRGQVFVLKTCQRTLVLGFNNTPNRIVTDLTENPNTEIKNLESFKGTEAYRFLLETICGLKSRVLGENEIVHQFKEAYSAFMTTNRPNRLVQNLLEKLFKDAKEIRSQHLKNIGLQTYAGITRKLLSERVKGQATITVLGSGELAEDLIKITHRRYKIVICARNKERVDELVKRYNIEVMDWSLLDQALQNENIVNTIGTSQGLLSPKQEQAFLESKSLQTLICLAEPRPYRWMNHPINSNIVVLDDIFEFAEFYNKEKLQKVSTATEAIKAKSEHRLNNFTLHLPFGWDELQFA